MRMRVIFGDPAHGTWNMAVDEAIMRCVTPPDGPTLRLYQWAEPTLSLGYFQSAARRQQHVSSRACPLVRRASGGGAIVHDRELTYSLTVALAANDRRRHTQWYTEVHDSLVRVLSHQFGVAAFQCCVPVAAVEEAFLCFQRRTPGDVLLQDPQVAATANPNTTVEPVTIRSGESTGEVMADDPMPPCTHKIAGSAQRRHRHALLQHGSILVRRSDSAPELPGIEEICGTFVDITRLAEAFVDELARRLSLQTTVGELTEQEREAALRIESTQFAANQWTMKR